jgi:hypothetical protein
MRPPSRWRLILPVAGVLIALAWPFSRYAMKVRAETTALQVLEEIRLAQTAFRTNGGRGGYASSLDSLTRSCDSSPAVLAESTLADLRTLGYEALLRARVGAAAVATDCLGRPTVQDYYVALQPVSATVDGQRAFAAAAEGDAFVFFDGLAPLEADMAAGGLATPVGALTAFRIP